MLSDSDKDRLVIGSGIDRGQLINTSRKTVRYIDTKHAIDSGIIHTLEECEFIGVGQGRLVNGTELFNDNMGVTDNLALRIKVLRGGIIVAVGINEVPGLYILNPHLDRESGVSFHGSEVLGESELGRGHIGGRGNGPHRSRVT
jgi:hypothetical protein